MARSSGRSAALVAAGIFLSRIAGLVRQRVFAHFLGLSDSADALTAAFRIPNFLQNLLGEGVLSASFIPVYARLVAEGKDRDARLVASAVAGLLTLFVAILVAIGVVAAPLFVDVLMPGFEGAKRDLTVVLVRILFPATAVLVLSAWCLGILNSHGRFFLSYAAPVAWNLAIIAVALAVGASRTQESLVVWIAWAAVGGSVLQLLVQLPAVLTLLRGFDLSVDGDLPAVRQVLANFGPALAGRGVNQISAFVDALIASLLGRGAVAAVSNAQMLYTLPVSLFGMSVSAAELPAMSAVQGSDAERSAALRGRLGAAQQRLAFFVVPCAAAFLSLGHVVAGGVFQTGEFTAADTMYVWAILAGSAVGLLAATLSRLSSSAFYALGDTRTPLRFATVRLTITAVLGYLSAVPLPGLLGLDLRWGAVGLTTTAGFAAWIEFLLLRRRLEARIGPARFPRGYLARLWAGGVLASAAGWGVLVMADRWDPLLRALAVGIPFVLVYAGVTLLLKVEAAHALLWGRRRA